MACCTSRDSALAGSSQLSRSGAGILAGRLRLRYVGVNGVRTRGPVTGRFYSFEARHPTAEVDARDAEFLLRNPVFRRA
jgi:hypothetical protein